jgi:CRP/FNR family transcriptional regulator, cyclic AMP receptor protein
MVMAKTHSRIRASFNIERYLHTAGVEREIARYRKGQVVFSQGEESKYVFYLQEGGVKLTVMSSAGKEAIVALLYEGDFFGEGCIAGQALRFATATAMEPTTVVVISKREMIRVIPLLSKLVFERRQ